MKAAKIISLITIVFLLLNTCTIPRRSIYLESNTTCTIGRINYLTFVFRDEYGLPLSDQQVQMQLGANTYYAKTDKYGKATFSVLATKELLGKQTASVSVVSDSSFNVSVELFFDKPTWLVLLWLGADNDLYRYALEDLEEVRSVGNNRNFSAVIMLDAYESNQDAVYVLSSKGDLERVEYFDNDIDSGSGIFLEEWLDKYLELFTADKYSLIIWNHGNAWLDDANQNYSTQAISYDYSSGNALTISELAAAVKSVLPRAGLEKFDVVGFDACYMGSFEVLYEVRHIAKYGVASSFTEPSYGWNYKFLGEISSSTDGYEFSKLVVDYYKAYAQSNSFYQTYLLIGLSLAVYDFEIADELSNSLDNLAYSLVDNITEVKDLDYSSVLSYYNDSLLYDLKGLCSIWKEYFQAGVIGEQANQSVRLIEDFVVYHYAERKIGQSIRQIDDPISIFFTKSSSQLSKYKQHYETLEFSENAWYNFIKILAN